MDLTANSSYPQNKTHAVSGSYMPETIGREWGAAFGVCHGASPTQKAGNRDETGVSRRAAVSCACSDSTVAAVTRPSGRSLAAFFRGGSALYSSCGR